MTIKHASFQNIIHKDYGSSFKSILEVRTFKQFLNIIDTISDNSIDYGYSDSEIEEEVLTGKWKFIGDLFEIFSETFFLQFSSDNRVGVFNYKPVSASDDNGVDGFGLGINGQPVTIQVKYRGNPLYKLTERDIKQFAYQSIVNYDVDQKSSGDMIIFTNCSGLHWYTESKVFNNKLRVINGEIISSMIDNNEGFWNTFKTIVENSIINMGIDELIEIWNS